jgi:hypothetical protein
MNRRRQRGVHLVEFAVAGVVFFMLLLAVIEFGRLLFTWHALDEASRRAARVGAVCPVGDPAIARVAVFNGPATSGASPLLPTLADSQVIVEYLDGNGAVLGNPAASYGQIRFVRATIRDFEQPLMVPLVGGTLRLPAVSAVLPRESLGVSPTGTGCF